MATHLSEARSSWNLLRKLLQRTEGVVLDGEDQSLTLAHVVAVSR